MGLHKKKTIEYLNVKDRNHKLSRKLVNKNDLLAFEKLNPAKMVSKKNKKVDKWTRDGILKSCWGQLFFFTTYKVKETGKWCELISAYNISKRCYKCGEINKGLKEEEIFICSNPKCDNILDRDVNASRNILWKAQKQLGLGKFAPKRLGTLSAERI
ncbi:zinc ribbon domain-containing protein [endosymbiont GvMRE of Glomus versiforme]|uniref:zinc ribbon domain-containing protein n=1 Tax=endosymbiont GvMRE of Glomus versiforme TaxID=2039283 RepID=UPI0011C3657E|nr:zinc ribbon domain-containing protein [endosymbiont GvMRE of Glomus versiforme]